MDKSPEQLQIRTATEQDAAELCAMLNEIIAIGGTTAYTNALETEAFAAKFLHDANQTCCFVAVDTNGSLAGFQWMKTPDNLPDGWGDIATFARVTPKIKGVGSMLFEQTRRVAQSNGLIAINATIRADNLGGLAFYDKIGFKTYAQEENTMLSDGTIVDRVKKKYSI